MKGRYGPFGGAYIPEIFVTPMEELKQMWETVQSSPEFLDELRHILKTYAGRPTTLTEVKHFAKAIDGPRIFLKREDLLHTGAHKINNTLGQCLIAKKMGKKRIIAETGAGQHGVATATACAFMGMECVVYMGKKDVIRQAPNVKKMQLLGAEVVAVEKGGQTLKDAINEAMRDWSRTYEDSHYCLGSALGPHPYPEMVAFFQKVIGEEAKKQLLEQEKQLPDLVTTCLGGGSNAIGLFAAFIPEKKVKLVGVEGGGHSKKLGEHAARFSGGSPGILHGTHSYVLQDENGQIAPTSSISAGLDYPGVGPEHAHLHEMKRAEYVSATNNEALEAFKLLSKTEGIIPALESAHALAYVIKVAKSYPKDAIILINLSGRGEKDLPDLFDRGLL
ncbi:tryptophan synthase subunit beta [Simkania sp.]|uniref:tryptophan synthase subunit beta n=1 Tax=Simkania sp. TaxID=34094 RepID=UPI003B5211B8